MLAAVKGIVQGNTVVIEDEDIRDYDGAEVIVTMLNCPQKKDKKAFVDAPPKQQERNHKRRR